VGLVSGKDDRGSRVIREQRREEAKVRNGKDALEGGHVKELERTALEIEDQKHCSWTLRLCCSQRGMAFDLLVLVVFALCSTACCIAGPYGYLVQD